VSFVYCAAVSVVCAVLLQPVSVVVHKASFPAIHRPLRLSPSDPCSSQIFGRAFAHAIFSSLVVTGII